MRAAQPLYARPDSEHTRHYLELAENVAAKCSGQEKRDRKRLTFLMVD